MRGVLLAILLIAPAAAAGPAASIRNNVVLIPNDDTIAAYNRAFNLTDKTVRFTRNDESGSFAAAVGPLVFDDDRGTQLTLDATTKAATYTISGFDFPFFGTTVRTLHISRFLAIYLAPPPAPATFRQYTDAELALETTPVIAPLLTTTLGQTNFRPPTVWVREHADRLVVTWWEDVRRLAIQAVLYRSGDIAFSYRSIANTRGGALLITSGNESWRTPVTIAAADDPQSDFTTSNPPEIAAMMDIMHAAVSRIGSTNVLQAVVRVRNPIDRSKLSQALGLTIYFGDNASLTATIGSTASADTWSGQLIGVTGPAPSMVVNGDTITFTFAQEYVLRDAASSNPILVVMANQFGGDSVNLAGQVTAPPRPMRTDFGAVAAVDSFDGPIADAFIVPFSNPQSVWNRVLEAFHFDPEEIDGVAIFQNFLTLGSPAASVGNAGVDNIGPGPRRSSSLPREPNIFDMHTIRVLWNDAEDTSAAIMMHEFGHRWLFSIGFEELHDGGHPKPTTDMRAAFPVLHPYDCSVMGGYTWTDNGDGTFTGPPDTCGYGYNWLELYLMGLAAPEEVPPVFYLENLDPSLDDVPFVEGETFHATRGTVTIGEVTDTLGPRFPAYPNTQRVFRVLFVLVYEPGAGLPDDDVANVARLAEVFKARFATATGGRAMITTSTGAPPSRRRSIRH